MDSSRPGVFVPKQDERQTYRYIEYMGDPLLQPVRSNEFGFLVRKFDEVCQYLNSKVSSFISNIFYTFTLRINHLKYLKIFFFCFSSTGEKFLRRTTDEIFLGG